MSVKEYVAQELDQLDDTELQQVADYIAFLQFRARRSTARAVPDSSSLAQLYAEFANEDRLLAEADLQTYVTTLEAEDKQ